MNPDNDIRVGDRVRIDSVYFPHRDHYLGREGVVDSIHGGDNSYFVVVDGDVPGVQINATRVTKVEENTLRRIRVGDRVRITKGHPSRYANVGVIGTVRAIGRWQYTGERYYTVRPDADSLGYTYDRYASEVEKVAPPTAPEPEPEIVLPTANLQAATFAHQLLGPDADLDKLIGVAEFAMDRRTLGTETTGTVHLLDGIVADVDPPEEKLTITDADGDRVEFTAHESDNPDGVNVTVNDVTAYLTQDDLAHVVAFLDGHRRTFTASA